MDYIQVDAKKVPWVFWVKIIWVNGWFKNYWTNRGANFYEIIIFKRIKISFGRPWQQLNINYYLSEDGNLKQIEKINKDNVKPLFNILINPNSNIFNK